MGFLIVSLIDCEYNDTEVFYMIEDFNDFLSIASLIAVIIAIIVILFKSYSHVRERQLIEEAIEYYKEV